MLVHPLHDVFLGYYHTRINFKVKNVMNMQFNKTYKGKMLPVEDKKKIVAQIKKTLAIYGEQLLKTKQNPNALFVLVKPSFYRSEIIAIRNSKKYNGMPFFYVSKVLEAYDAVMKRFYDFGKKQLKERFIVNSFDPYFSEFFLPSKLYSQLDNKNLTLKSFGEYISKEHGCVNCWSNYVNNHFKKKNINLKKINIVSDKSFHLPVKPIDFYKGIYKNVVTGHQRKKLLGATSKQRKRVKKKLPPKILGKKIR